MVETLGDLVPVQDNSCLTALGNNDSSIKLDDQKIDHITSLQEGIDGLSLSLFEALRQLRDAVAPESGNLGAHANGTTVNSNGSPTNNGANGESTENDFEDFRKIEMEKDAELVKRVANTVLEKSADIDRRVSSLPGMHRTRTEQMEYIQRLLEKNRATVTKLEQTYSRAEERRKKVRNFVRDHTCESLGILDE